MDQAAAGRIRRCRSWLCSCCHRADGPRSASTLGPNASDVYAQFFDPVPRSYSRGMTGPDEDVLARIDHLAPQLLELSHALYADPELAYQEVRSAVRCADLLEVGGFDVEREVYGLPTAFAARGGGGGLHLVICAEYDALPGVGHACGHNVIAASAVGAGLGLLPVAAEAGLRLTVLGTPAEEAGGGKVDLILAGAFDGVDAAMMMHPAPHDTLALSGSPSKSGRS